MERRAKDTGFNIEVSCWAVLCAPSRRGHFSHRVLLKEAYGPEHLEPWDVRMAELQESLVMNLLHEAD